MILPRLAALRFYAGQVALALGLLAACLIVPLAAWLQDRLDEREGLLP